MATYLIDRVQRIELAGDETEHEGLYVGATGQMEDIETEAEFRSAFVDRTFIGDGVRFTIHANGVLTGEIGGSRLSGTWYWGDGYFCRTATLGDERLALDCELIEECSNQMKYTRNRGKGTSTIVAIDRAGTR